LQRRRGAANGAELPAVAQRAEHEVLVALLEARGEFDLCDVGARARAHAQAVSCTAQRSGVSNLNLRRYLLPSVFSGAGV
jgi:hypothetical protein